MTDDTTVLTTAGATSVDAAAQAANSTAAPKAVATKTTPTRKARRAANPVDQVELPSTIPATKDNPEPEPPAGGSWLREQDGSLRPRDAATATAAGLAWPG